MAYKVARRSLCGIAGIYTELLERAVFLTASYSISSIIKEFWQKVNLFLAKINANIPELSLQRRLLCAIR